jgi:septal ring factor EnvC (AmiA/AmiB activator)
MNRVLGIFNFLGVAVLVVLCAAQWQTNSRLEYNVEQLDKTRSEQSAKIADQEKTLKDDAADLEDLRQRLSMSESELKSAIADRDRLAAEDKLLKMAINKWMDAVKQRDATIKQASELIQKLAGERNDAIAKFNALADKYNAIAKQLQDTQGGK